MESLIILSDEDLGKASEGTEHRIIPIGSETTVAGLADALADHDIVNGTLSIMRTDPETGQLKNGQVATLDPSVLAPIPYAPFRDVTEAIARDVMGLGADGVGVKVIPKEIFSYNGA